MPVLSKALCASAALASAAAFVVPQGGGEARRGLMRSADDGAGAGWVDDGDLSPEVADPTGAVSGGSGSLLAGLAMGLAAAAAGAAAGRRRPRAVARRAAGSAEVAGQPAGTDLENAIPFLGEPGYRKFAANVPGDKGFDPLGLCDSVEKFRSYREAEIKHCRLAMLAAVGWPLAEEWHTRLAQALGKANELEPDGRVPSVLNGGLVDNTHNDELAFVFWGLVLVGGAIDVSSKDYAPEGADPWDYGFDPLRLKNKGSPFGIKLRGDRPWMEEAELKHGRLAMVAITAFALQEFATRIPVVKETPLFFPDLF